MATKDYTLSDIKELVLGQINKVKGLATPFGYEESEQAYDEAVRDCGFELPETTDDDKDPKYKWLISRMRRWFVFQLWTQYPLRFDSSDMKSSQLVKNLQLLCEKLDKEFTEAKADDKTAALFLDATDVFGDSSLVVGPGFEEDRTGLSIEDRT